MARHGAYRDFAISNLDARQFGNGRQVDKLLRAGQAQLHGGSQALTTRQQFRLAAFCQASLSLGNRNWFLIFERIHGNADAVLCQSSLFSHDFGCFFDRLDDVVVARTAAQITIKLVANLLFGRLFDDLE